MTKYKYEKAYLEPNKYTPKRETFTKTNPEYYKKSGKLFYDAWLSWLSNRNN